MNNGIDYNICSESREVKYIKKSCTVVGSLLGVDICILSPHASLLIYAETPELGSVFEQKNNDGDSSEGAELAFSAREMASRFSSRSRDTSYSAPSPAEDPSDGGHVLATRNSFARRRPRRRAWADLNSEGPPSSARNAGGRVGSSSEHQSGGSR